MTNNTPPLISVIVPVFNTEEYVARCLEAIINQSIKELEIIVVNDLSTDKSEEIILEHVEKHSNIRYVKMNSKGMQGGARNVGLSIASGKFIGFVDSDDWIDTNMYEKMLQVLNRTNADIAVCGVLKEFENPRDAHYRYIYETENVISGKMALELLSRRYNQDIGLSPIVCNKLYKADFIRENKFFFLENNLSDDDAFNFVCFLHASRIAITPNTYYHYYQRTNSITHSFSKKHIDDMLNAFLFIKTYLTEKGLFEQYKDVFFPFFEKCLAFVLNILVNTESISKQKEYMNYFLDRAGSTLTLSDYIGYVGAQRIRDFLNPSDYKMK